MSNWIKPGGPRGISAEWSRHSGAALRRAGLVFALAVASAAAHADPAWITDDKGCKHSNPYPSTAGIERITWTGACVDGFADGEGVEQWLLDGKPGGRFTGTVRRGVLAGSGVYLSSDGGRYEGGYVDGKRSGHGVFHWANGSSYEGDYARGDPNGQGIFQWAGGRYDGGVVDGKRSGHGVWQFASGARLEGEFLNGSLVGTATVQLDDGTRYEAHFLGLAANEAPASVCSQMGKPASPPVNWVGTARFSAVALFHDGQAIVVQATAPTSIGNDAVERAFVNAVETTIRQTYRCPGDHIVQQDFVFKVGRPDPIWIADDKGCKHALRHPPLLPNEALTWTGSCVEGYADGEGVEEYLQNGKPIGRFNGTMRQGLYVTEHGSLWSIDGSAYEGNFVHGEPSGRGVFHFANGTSYDGEIENGQLNGQGRATLLNDGSYQGGFANGSFSGHGVLQYLNGTRLEGVFVNNRVSGHGVLVQPDGSRYDGDFVEGLQTGHGTMQWADGSSYQGDFLKGRTEGHGVRYELNGDRMEGEFVDGHLRGPVTVVQPDGARYQAHYNEGPNAASSNDADLLCTQMGKVELPAVEWAGEASIKATATFHDGRVATVRAVAQPHLDDPLTEAVLAHAVEETMRQTYQCPGDHVIEQSFDFKIEE